MARPSPTPRTVAAHLLDGVLERGKLISDLTRGPAWDALTPPERATAQRLALDTLRGLERADRVLKPHLRKEPPPRVKTILRLATVELCQGGAAHGIVNAAVDAVAMSKKTAGFRGLVNAVLRKVAEAGPDEWAKLRAPRLPKWLRGPLVAAWGGEAVIQMEQAHFVGAPLDLTARTNAQAVAAQAGGTLLPTGSVRLHSAGQVTALPGYETGDWWVQDAAAALPVRLLGDIVGKTALDLCAAPGGKTLQLAAGGANVTAVDLSAPRMERVRENLSRVGMTATCRVEDALSHQGTYDIVLLDAPCSATGTIRRHPDLPHARTGDGISELIDLQAQLLDHALTLLTPGGRLVYCTCSLLPDEGECQVDEARARHPDLKVLPATAKGLEPSWRSEEGGIRLRPDHWADQGGLDGFYMAVLQKGG